MLQCGNSRCTASVLRVYCECTESLELERGVASAVLGVVEAVLAADCAVCRLCGECMLCAPRARSPEIYT